MMQITLSTHNPSKALQIRAAIAPLPIEIRTLAEQGITDIAVEDGNSLGENATKKALFAHGLVGGWCMADDTGVFIDALNGEPGKDAAEWGGAQLTINERVRYILERMAHIPEARRTAYFQTVAVVIAPDGQQHQFVGEVHGHFLLEPRTQLQKSMPYSEMFVPDGHTKTWAEMTVDEENKISHRGQAFGKVQQFFLQRLS